MRTENQIKRKLNELVMQKKAAAERDEPNLQNEIKHLEAQILLLEWVLDAPSGSYHMK